MMRHHLAIGDWGRPNKRWEKTSRWMLRLLVTREAVESRPHVAIPRAISASAAQAGRQVQRRLLLLLVDSKCSVDLHAAAQAENLKKAWGLGQNGYGRIPRELAPPHRHHRHHCHRHHRHRHHRHHRKTKRRSAMGTPLFGCYGVRMRMRSRTITKTSMRMRMRFFVGSLHRSRLGPPPPRCRA